MRFYSFINFYLSSIQQGIQTAHLVHEMFNEYDAMGDGHDTQSAMLNNWSFNHKTIMTMNGGNNQALEELYAFFEDRVAGRFPYIKFHEDEQSLGGVLTGVAIILPEIIYETAEKIRNRSGRFVNVGNKTLLEGLDLLGSLVTNDDYSFTPFEVELIERLNTYGLAK